jgi:hypothetical protein
VSHARGKCFRRRQDIQAAQLFLYREDAGYVL